MKKRKAFRTKITRLYPIFTLTITGFMLTACVLGQENVQEQVQTHISKMEASIENPVNPDTSTTSNPYDDIQNNEHFEAILELGIPALPELKQSLAHSDQDGLVEYIYAIALEKISKTEMSEQTEWRTGKEFYTIYSAYLKEIPDKVTSIAAEPVSDKEKIAQLKALGVPAIPYIFDVINHGKQELSPALHYLTDNESKSDMRKWSVEHIDQLNLLTDFVEE
ncbi:hypothetical protein [Marinicrinis sediminis]|uniref:Uncharacterized protein n=1 Tax=Marinicrinis sediminis TaxID=1652465 RepID=A0ABW5RA15_9BACL